MSTKLNPYLSFNGNARQAMEFYQSVLGGNLSMNTFNDYGAAQDPSEGAKIMHATLDAPNSITLMGSDTPNGMDFNPGASIRISLSGENDRELRGYWEKLSTGSTIELPLEQAPWGDTFGMLTDKFGIQWMVNISGQKA